MRALARRSDRCGACAKDRFGCDEKSQGIVILQPGAWAVVRKIRASEAVDVTARNADTTHTNLSIRAPVLDPAQDLDVTMRAARMRSYAGNSVAMEPGGARAFFTSLINASDTSFPKPAETPRR